MDPDACLREIRALVVQLQACDLIWGSHERPAELGVELAEWFEGLDAWIAGGGFLPVEWWRNQEQHKG